MNVDQARVRALAEAYTAAWNSGSPDAVASFFAPEGQIVINRGTPWIGREGVAAMAAGFFADVPDLALVCDEVRCAGDHVVYAWTFTGTHAATRNQLRVAGWEEWDLDPDLQFVASRGWFDTADYARQTNSSSTPARTAGPRAEEARVLAAEDAYVAAEIARDEGALRRVVDEAFRFNTSHGTTTDKEALVRGVLQMGLVGQVITERSVHLEDDVALVFGTTELRFERSDTASVLRYTAT
ncbi:hypothetical protein BH23DEI1_BH23DEI1_07860 [soil metagenome]